MFSFYLELRDVYYFMAPNYNVHFKNNVAILLNANVTLIFYFLKKDSFKRKLYLKRKSMSFVVFSASNSFKYK